MEAQSEHVQTHRQQWERHTQAVRPNSAPLLYSAVHLAFLFDVRENPFHKRQQGCVFAEWRLMWVQQWQGMCKLSACTYYISAALAVCAYHCLSLSERIPLCIGCTILHREGWGAGRALGTLEELSRHFHNKTVRASHSSNINTRRQLKDSVYMFCCELYKSYKRCLNR